MFKYLLLIILFSTTCLADDIVVDAGLGILSSKGYSLSQNKFAKIGLQEDLWYNFKQRFNVGGWLDSRNQRTNAAFTGYQLGFQVENDCLEASIFSGPTLISSTDQALGGFLQFNESIYLGIVDKLGSSIGISYNHLSSAGISMPNLGRDYFGLEIKFPI